MPRMVRAVGVAALLIMLAATLSTVLAAPSNDDPAPPPPNADAEPPDSITIASADGTPKITEAEALAAAREFALYGAADRATSVTAEFVLFSKDSSYEIRPDGTRDYKYQDRPVWLITYKGVDIPSHGGAPWHNTELNVIVDAETGKALRGYSYR